MKIQEITSYIEKFAPPSYQESYDNASLIVGDPKTECTGVLLTLDATEPIVDEAIEKGCNLIVAHHPIVFRGLKRFNGRNYVERTVIKAIKNDIAIFAAHTNLDNVQMGVNRKICKKIGIENPRTLVPKSGILKKLYTFCPIDHAEKVRLAIFEAGAGKIGDYDQCSFNVSGTGTFRGSDDTSPFVGKKGEQHQENEVKIEVVFPAFLQSKIIRALNKAHPYEEVAYDVMSLDNFHPQVGSGMIGVLKEEMEGIDFLHHLKKAMKTDCVRYTELINRKIKKVAVCGGSGSFLLKAAKAQGADVFVTADFKYHEFFDAENQIIIADIGHFESEQFTVEIFYKILTEKFANFVVLFSDINTNPIKYL